MNGELHDLIHAIDVYSEAKARIDEKWKTPGEDFYHFYRNEIRALDQAKASLGDALNAYIDARIAKSKGE